MFRWPLHFFLSYFLWYCYADPSHAPPIVFERLSAAFQWMASLLFFFLLWLLLIVIVIVYPFHIATEKDVAPTRQVWLSVYHGVAWYLLELQAAMSNQMAELA